MKSKTDNGNLSKRRNQLPPKPSKDSGNPGPSVQHPSSPSSNPFEALLPNPPLPSSSNPFMILTTDDSTPNIRSFEPPTSL